MKKKTLNKMQQRRKLEDLEGFVLRRLLKKETNPERQTRIRVILKSRSKPDDLDRYIQKRGLTVKEPAIVAAPAVKTRPPLPTYPRVGSVEWHNDRYIERVTPSNKNNPTPVTVEVNDVEPRTRARAKTMGIPMPPIEETPLDTFKKMVKDGKLHQADLDAYLKLQ